uniref:WD repeat domain 21 n=1 Tax=Oncorhynchus mykiss TaxID=8022 RepID=A0A8K9UYD5_ONCMY
MVDWCKLPPDCPLLFSLTPLPLSSPFVLPPLLSLPLPPLLSLSLLPLLSLSLITSLSSPHFFLPFRPPLFSLSLPPPSSLSLPHPLSLFPSLLPPLSSPPLLSLSLLPSLSSPHFFLPFLPPHPPPPLSLPPPLSPLLSQGDSACERVFTVNDVSHGGCKYGIMNFRGCSRGSLSVKMCDNLYFTNRKVNSICWASVTHSDSHVLLCLVGMAETPGCVSLLPASLFSNSNPDQPGMLCSFKISTAWSCAWCLNPQADKTFSTGLSRRVIVTDAVTGRRQTYGIGSDVLAQQFALRAPVLFNGCRSGEIFSIDLRQKGRRDHSWKACRFSQDSAITSVRILQDENYLLAADMIGEIKLWDVRVTKPVRKYEGHHNQHAYLPLHVNEAEGLLMAVGQDCYTRLWSLGDGQLLRTIPSPHPAGKDMIPSVVFSSQLGGNRGLPGLLMAVRHDLYYFPYNSDYQEGGGVVTEAAC